MLSLCVKIVSFNYKVLFGQEKQKTLLAIATRRGMLTWEDYGCSVNPKTR